MKKSNLPCNQRSSEFTNEQNINIHNKKCHKVKCKLCNLTFKIGKKLQKHEEIFYDESPTVT